MNNSRIIAYRPDIDGLRAIAIILVLVYHGGLVFFPSGFIGVDVFFVISGFLITNILYSSLNKQNFSFTNFYNRRLWRLQPILVCFLFVITTLTLLLFLPDDLVQYSKSARKTSLFTSNMFFNKTTTGYFSPSAQQLPLLHTWSLSIEWQCYLILPIVIYGLYRFLNKKYFIVLINLLTLLFFIISMHYSNTSAAQTYYQFSSRFFEFLVGSCITLIPNHSKIVYSTYARVFAKNQSAHAATAWACILNIMGAVALITIFYIAHLDHIVLGYPNEYAAIVCIAVAVLIILGMFYPKLLCIRMLSLKPIVFIGLLSYSLYVWHWGIFAILRYQSIEETPFVLGVAYLLIFIVSYCSWKYIEKPARSLNRLPLHYAFSCLVLLPIVLIHGAAYFIIKNNGLPERFNEELVSVYKKLNEYASLQRPLCISNEQADFSKKCIVGAVTEYSKTALMIGDSFANHYWGFMDILGQDAKVSIIAQGTSSCITLPGIYLYDWWHFKDSVYQECYNKTQKYYQMVKNNHYDYVIIGQVWENYLKGNIINHLNDAYSLSQSKDRLEAALDKALALIINSGAKPVIIKTTALMQQNFHDCFFKHIKFHRAYNPEECNFNLTLSDGARWFNVLFDKMKVRYPQLILIDPTKVQCKQGRCSVDINGVPVYRDAGHITDYASYQLGKQYLHEFSNPFL